MAVIGILANGVSVSTGNNIVGASNSTTHHFGPSTIFGHPQLQSCFTQNDNDTSVQGCDVSVSQFVDASGTHNVDLNGIFDSKCTSITYFIVGRDGGSARALCITEFLG